MNSGYGDHKVSAYPREPSGRMLSIHACRIWLKLDPRVRRQRLRPGIAWLKLDPRVRQKHQRLMRQNVEATHLVSFK